MTWFEDLTGFSEMSPPQVRRNLTLDGETLTSRANGRVMRCGRLETPSLGELRERVRGIEHQAGALSVREVIADVRDLHTDPSNAGALFQVASQFNLLEMASPNVTPDQGVGIYEGDHTQGPACAVAAGAGTIYRNYFTPVDKLGSGRCPTEPDAAPHHNDVTPVSKQIGQSKDHQIDCLADLGHALGNENHTLWTMRNGYALATRAGLTTISQRLQAASAQERDDLRALLRIGIQWHTEVTLNNAAHTVSQAYCSALPVAYTAHPPELWEDFARLVLEAAYEATICTAILNAVETGNPTVFLTLLGGGVFGNRRVWIMDSILRALKHYAQWTLDVAIVSHGRPNPDVQRVLDKMPNHSP
jgi:hypothetical protein